jgi:hypothetical protein
MFRRPIHSCLSFHRPDPVRKDLAYRVGDAHTVEPDAAIRDADPRGATARLAAFIEEYAGREIEARRTGSGFPQSCIARSPGF